MEFAPKGKGTAVKKVLDCQREKYVFWPFGWLETAAPAFKKHKCKSESERKWHRGKRILRKLGRDQRVWLQMALRWEKCGSVRQKTKKRRSRREAKAEEKRGKQERSRRINSIFRSAPCIPHPPCGPRARAHVSTLVRICFYYYMIGCAENIGKLYVPWEGAGRGGGVIAGASSPTMSSTFH